MYAVTNGEVVAVPERLIFDPNIECSMKWDTDMELKVGDNVIYHYLVFFNATDPNLINDGKLLKEEDGNFYLYVPYDSIFLAIRDEKIVMLNGWVLAKKVQKDSTFIVPDKYKDIKNLFSIHHNGSNNRSHEHTEYVDAEVNVGDFVITDKSCDIPLQHKTFSLLNEEYFRIQKKNILAIK